MNDVKQNNSAYAKIRGFLIGIASLYAWFYLKQFVYEYMSLSRFIDHWPYFAKMVAPIVILLVLGVLPISFLISRLAFNASKISILAFVALYIVNEAYALSKIGPEILIVEGVLWAIMNIGLAITWRIARERNTRNVC